MATALFAETPATNSPDVTPPEMAGDGYFDLDARLAWHPTKNLELSVVGQNLLHDPHAEYGFPGPDQVQIERSVYGKIAWHF